MCIKLNKFLYSIVLSLVLMGCQSNDGDVSENFSSEVLSFSGSTEHPFVNVDEKPLSTFSTDVDTASYTYARGQINTGQRPDPTRIRSEEFTNYFSYPDSEPKNFEGNVGVSTEVGPTPWNPEHRLLKTIVKAKVIPLKAVPPLNLTFLIDVSGSMSGESRLGLAKYALHQLVSELRPVDKISIVTYSDNIQVLLDSVKGDDKNTILAAISKLVAAGSTNGGAGIQKAYQLALKNHQNQGLSRVVLSTDGDFNVGIVDPEQLTQYVSDQAKEGIYLTVHGYGMGNFHDELLEKITNGGNGNYTYIDSRAEAERVFKTQITQTLSMVAKDAKIQIKFNSQRVQAYRLIGYENRYLNNEDFVNDEVDAGDLGSGHVVLALYEIIPKSKADDDRSNEIATFSIRYKEISSSEKLKQQTVVISDSGQSTLSRDLCFASAVASFALKLRDSKYLGGFDFPQILELSQSCDGYDTYPDRLELIDLIEKTSAF